MRRSRARSAPKTVARAVVLGSTTAVLTLGLASSAMAADDEEKKEDDGNPGPAAAAIAGVALGALGFAASEAGNGPYPDEHH